MAKKTAFFCRNCGYESVKWLGQCPSCKEWNTFDEAPIMDKKEAKHNHSTILAKKNTALLLDEIEADTSYRMNTGLEELNRVLGGGLVQGSVVLLGGDPGIGKSTLLLQICDNLSKEGNILYISGEESAAQIKMRAERIGLTTKKLAVLSENNLDDIYKFEQWQEKAETSAYYKNAIYTWTDLDVRKQKCAKENNLNYKVIY